MSDKCTELLNWVQSLSWDKCTSKDSDKGLLFDTMSPIHIYDKEVQILISQLQNRIQALSSETAELDPISQKPASNVKLVAVGDGAVGKTSLLMSYITGDFPPTYVPTVFENHSKHVIREKDDSSVILRLWDTAGQEDYDRLRPLSYPGSDIVLLCFSLVSKPSLDSIKCKWHPEIAHYVPDIPTILVGLKKDLRDQTASVEDNSQDKSSQQFITSRQGEEIAKFIGASSYIEVSSINKYNLEKTFQDAINTVLEIRHQALNSSKSSPDMSTSSGTEVHNRKKLRHKNCIIF